MKFRTEYQASPSPLRLDPRKPVVLVGSCFAQNIARKMEECGWEAFNGVGTLYNPLSIAKVLQTLLLSEEWEEIVGNSIFENGGRFASWLFDSHFSGSSPRGVLDAVGECRKRLLETLGRAQALVVTFGTSWCYHLAAGRPGYVVANCHKVPASRFIRSRVAVNAITDQWLWLLRQIKEKYPELKVILTVSPVRHLKDGFEGNARSKAVLLLAAEILCQSSPGDTLYFPAFEIVNDDLRDYRFYASDLCHSSEQAVEYIWDKFRATFLDPPGEALLQDGLHAFKARNHRPIIQ